MKTKNRVSPLLKAKIIPPVAKPERSFARNKPVIDLLPIKLKLKHILVPIDFSDTSKKALEYAVPFAEQFNGKITLIHVVQPAVYPSDEGFMTPPITLELKSSQTLIDEIAIDTVPRHLLEKTIVTAGQPYQEIVDAARSKTDLIIITTRGLTGLKHVWMGSTAERVVRHAPCPVLCLKEKEHEFI